jgi:hypothetical protein
MGSFCLVEVGNHVIKSMEMVSHFHYGMVKGCSSPAGFQCSTLTYWHSMHWDKYLAMSFLNLGQ